MNYSWKAAVTAALAAVVVSGTSVTAAFAETQWQQNHPRREQVNNRLHNQNARIHQAVREGEMSRGQAARLHAADRGVRQEERDMAAQNGGHITRGEQAVLNRQENRISNRIGE